MKQTYKTLILTFVIVLLSFSAFALESTLTFRGGVSGSETDIYNNKQLNGMVGIGYELWLTKWLSLGINPYVTRVQAGPENMPYTPTKVAWDVPPYNFQSNVVGGDLLFRLRPNWKVVAPYLTAGAGVVNFFPKTRSGAEIGGYPETFDFTSFSAPTVGAGLHFFTKWDVDFELGFQKNFLMTDYLEGWEKGEFNDNIWMAFLGVSHTFGKTKAAPVVIPTVFEINPTSRNVSEKAGTTSFFIDANKPWTATENETWLSVAPTSGMNAVNFVVTYDANNTPDPRTGYIYVTSEGITRTLTVTQEGYKEMLKVTPGVQNVKGTAGATSFNVESNLPWVVTENESWLAANPTQGVNNGSIVVSYDANPYTVGRTGQLTVTGGEKAETVTVVQEARAELMLKPVYFEFDRYNLTDEAIGILNDNIVLLMAHPDVKIEISGHTDFMGTEKYNENLSMNRAKAVRDYLVKNQIDKKRLTIKGMGETMPASTNDTDEGRALNRRAEFKEVQ